jgi:hypothetical protein
MKTDKVTPIFYVGGSGGHFLSALLNCAKVNHNEPLNFSEFGHAHNTLFGINQYPMTDENIESIKEKHKDGFRFISTHTDIDFLLTHFDKLIIITYETDEDIKEITAARIIKVGYGIHRIQLDRIPNLTTNHIIDLRSRMKDFDICSKDNILCISWANLYKDDPKNLISILHSFTNIPKENFSIEIISQWRTLTMKSIQKYIELCP